MAKTDDPIRQAIRRKRGQLSRTLGVARRLRAEIEALEKTLPRRHRQLKERNQKPGKKRIRPLTQRWQQVLRFIGNSGPMGTPVRDILVHCDRLSLDVSERAFRSHMSLYGKKGLVKRVHKNTFALTDQGVQTVQGSQFDDRDDPDDYLHGGE
jgi:hypothetical protein